MRIDRLDLTAFGCFTGHSLDLAAPGVHVVAGPNEAGKSTALHALAELLYGIGVRTTYDFVHAKDRIRLGAALRGLDGATVEVVRHKRNKNPLTAPDGTPLPPGTLDSLLGGVDREEFTTVFALHHADLRAGGQLLLEGRGDIGRALFESRSAQRLGSALAILDQRIGELYAKGGKRRINNGVKQLVESKKDFRDAQLRVDSYTAKLAELTEATARHERLTAERDRARAELTRLERISHAWPGLGQRTAQLERRQSLVDAGPLVPPDVKEELAGLRDRLRTGSERARQARSDLAENERESARLADSLAANEALLAAAESVRELYEDRKAVQDAESHAAQARERAAARRADARALLTSVRPDASLDAPATWSISSALRSRVRELVEERAARDAAAKEAMRSVTERRRKLEKAEAAAATPEAATSISRGDPAALRAASKRVPTGLPESVAAAERRLAEEGERADVLLGRWSLAELGLAAVEALPLPARAEVDAHRAERDRVAKAREKAADRRTAAAETLQLQRAELQVLLHSDPPPSEDDLSEARRHRDLLWQQVRAAHDDDSCIAYEKVVAHADTLVDQMRHDAERVNRRLVLTAQVRLAESALADAEAGQAALAAEADQLATAWAVLWEAAMRAGVPVPSAEAAPQFLDALADLRSLAEIMRGVRAELAQDRSRLRAAVERVQTVLAESGEMADGVEDLAELLELARERAAEFDAAAAKRDKAQEKVTTAREELADASDRVKQCQQDLNCWQQEWTELLTNLALADNLNSAAAVAALEKLEKAADAVAAAKDDESVAAAAETRVAAFDNLLATVWAATRPETSVPVSLARFAVVTEVYEQVERARKEAEHGAELTESAAQLNRELAEHRAAAAAAQAEIAALVQKYSVPDEAALLAAADRGGAVADLDRRIAEVEISLRGSGPLDVLEAEAAALDADQLPVQVDAARNRVKELDEAHQRSATGLGALRKEFALLDGSARGAEAAERRSECLAQLVEDTEEYLRLNLARQVLLRCMEEYRQANQDPVFARAQAVFARLTGGRFDRFLTDTDAHGGAVLRLGRSGGPSLAVDELSEGTRDQLYLALRLASLERYADSGRQLPIAFDDVFMAFDEERTRAGLGVLDEMAERFQVIVFTHHDHLAEQATKALPPGRAHIHRLPRFALAQGAQ